MVPESPQSIEIFFCYAHEDKPFRDKLDRALAALKHAGLIRSWYDGEIVPGDPGEKIIKDHLNKAQIVLLLISVDFINSDYSYRIEMKRALERHNTGMARVIPVLVRPVYWQGTPIGELQMLPTDARPIALWPNQEEALEDVAREIHRTVNEMLQKQKPNTTVNPTRVDNPDTGKGGDPLQGLGVDMTGDPIKAFGYEQYFRDIQELSPKPHRTLEGHIHVSLRSATRTSSLQQQAPYSTFNNSTKEDASTLISSPSTGNILQPETNMQHTSKDFFISYADADLTFATWIEARLRGAGYSTILPAYDIRPGANLAQELNRSLEEAQRTIVVLSPEYLQSLAEHPAWAATFFQDMAGRQRKLVPIYVRECRQQLKGLLGPIVPIDLVGKDEILARALLLDGVNLGEKRPKISPPFPG